MSLPWDGRTCPAWNNKIKQCSLKIYPCVTKQIHASEEKTCSEHCLFIKRGVCTYDEEVRISEKICTSEEWCSCLKIFKFFWNFWFKWTQGKRKDFYKERFGKFDNENRFKGCPYLYIKEHRFASSEIICLAQNTYRPVTFSEFYWFCGGATRPDFEKKKLYYDGTDDIKLYRTLMFDECPCFRNASVAINEVLPSKNELRTDADQEKQRQARIINRINQLNETAEKVVDEMSRMSEKTNKSSESGCFITTATLRAIGGKDDGYELNQFRIFRDTYLRAQSDGEKLITQYYKIAPQIVGKIDNSPAPQIIYENIWKHYLSICLKFIENKEYAKCKECYADMVKDLKASFIDEGMENS